MIPPVATVLQTLAVSLMGEIAPQVQPEYSQKTLGMVAMLLLMANDDWDRGVARRVEENAELRRVFGAAAAHVADDGLRVRLEEAAAQTDQSLLVSELQRSNDELRALLIDLHQRVEELDTSEARRIEEEIWTELRLSTERRQLATALF